MTHALVLNNIEVIYDHVFLAIKGVSIEVPQGGMVALLGANGAGKSTTLKAISGLLKSEHGEITRGDVKFLGQDISSLPPQDRVKLGIAQVLEGRRVFVHLTPDENLRVLDRLVERFENGMPEPRLMWQRPNDAAFVERLAAGTVGFRLTPARVVAKRKLSQNKPVETIESVIAALESEGPYTNRPLAAEMRRAQVAREGNRA